MTKLREGRMGCGPDEGPPALRPVSEREGMPSRFHLMALFRSLSGMLQAPTPERYCEQWRRLDNALFEVGSRMFGEREMEDGLQAFQADEVSESSGSASDDDMEWSG